MDEDHSVTVPAGITTAETEIGVQGARLDSSTADYSPDDEDLDEATAAAAAAAEATRDTLAEGLVARLLRPCVDRLDASVQCTRLSQLDLKLQLDSLATELKRLSLAQHDYLFAATSISSSSTSSNANKTVSSSAASTAKITTDTCTLLDGYARRLCDARAKIAVVGNILESTQERLRALSHRIGREHNNRRSLLEPQTVVPSVTPDEFVEEDKNQNIEDIEEIMESKLVVDDGTPFKPPSEASESPKL